MKLYAEPVLAFKSEVKCSIWFKNNFFPALMLKEQQIITDLVVEMVYD